VDASPTEEVTDSIGDLEDAARCAPVDRAGDAGDVGTDTAGRVTNCVMCSGSW
jgi:hypothetical protein